MVNRNHPLFSWSDVERRPELERLEMVVKALPDEELLTALEQRRGRRRDDYGIRPLIEPRELWKEEKKERGYDPGKAITRPLYPDRADSIVPTEKGQVCCFCPETGRQRLMAFQGFKGGTLKYRCPAAAYGYHCAGRESCYRAAGSQAGAYGCIVRIPLAEQDRRIFTPPRTGARPGSGATGVALRWSGSTADSTTTSGSSGTFCAGTAE